MTKLTVAIFITVMATANLLVAQLGPWITPFNAFVLVGLSMVSRDVLHQKWHDDATFYPKMFGMIAAAGLAAWAVNPAAGRIAIASATALTVSALAETATFQRLINRRWMVRSNGSNLPGAIVDTVVFTTVAFGFAWGLLAVMAAQAGMKIAGGLFWSALLNPRMSRQADPERTAA